MPQYELIPLSQIHEDPAQPRRRIDEQAVQEMAETIRTVGVIEPVTVRPDKKGFKLVVGHRRARAARIAGLREIPCIVRRDIDDLEVMRVQAIEDAQTAELDPRDRYAFWARLWQAESTSNPQLSFATFAREVIGKSEQYVRSGIQVAEEAPDELQAILGAPEDGLLNPSYARYLIRESSLSTKEKVAVGKKIASGSLPASGGKIAKTLKAVRDATPSVREKLIYDPEYSLDQAEWALRGHARTQQAARAKRDRLLTESEVAFKLLRAILDFHITIDPHIAPFLPEPAWEEIDARLTELTKRIEVFRRARSKDLPPGEELLDAIDVKALEALLAIEERPQ